MQNILAVQKKKAQDLIRISDSIWDYAELGFRETKSVKVQVDYLRAQGFKVTERAGGIPTAFVAEWGEGRPHIGFLGEFDALAGLSQEVSAEKKPRVLGAPGHGCGHNLLGAGSLGAAVILKEILECTNRKGTVRYYGCPAEEVLAGKVFMAREGLFSDLDAAITWHPSSLNTIGMTTFTALNSVKFQFFGKTAHAASAPHLGRSALDAVEIMNVGSNYLREHIIKEASLHYAITSGGDQPNVVPAFAEVWYFVRAPKRYQVDEIYERLLDIAKGAALITGTTYNEDFLTGGYEVLVNESLANVLWDCLKQVGPPEFDQEDLKFAQKLSHTFEASMMKGMHESPLFQQFPKLKTEVLSTTLIPPSAGCGPTGGSTDVGDVSWIVPTVQMSAACMPMGCPGHSWQATAASATPAAHKGMLVGAATMALCGLKLIDNPELLQKAKDEFKEKTKDTPYKCAFPEGRPFPFDSFCE